MWGPQPLPYPVSHNESVTEQSRAEQRREAESTIMTVSDQKTKPNRSVGNELVWNGGIKEFVHTRAGWIQQKRRSRGRVFLFGAQVRENVLTSSWVC